jgi:hypothetical protein
MISNLKVPFGTAKMVRVTGAKYLAWEDAFEVDFEDGLTFLEPHVTIRKANKISSDAKPVRVELDEEPCIGFFVRYDNPESFRGSFVVLCARAFSETFQKVKSADSAQNRQAEAMESARQNTSRSGTKLRDQRHRR